MIPQPIDFQTAWTELQDLQATSWCHALAGSPAKAPCKSRVELIPTDTMRVTSMPSGAQPDAFAPLHGSCWNREGFPFCVCVYLCMCIVVYLCLYVCLSPTINPPCVPLKCCDSLLNRGDQGGYCLRLRLTAMIGGSLLPGELDAMVTADPKWVHRTLR